MQPRFTGLAALPSGDGSTALLYVTNFSVAASASSPMFELRHGLHAGLAVRCRSARAHRERDDDQRDVAGMAQLRRGGFTTRAARAGRPSPEPPRVRR